MSATTTGPAPWTEAEAVGMSTERLGRLRTRMQALVDDGKLAGLSTLVARRGAVVASDEYGVLDVTTRRSTPPDAIYNIASMTKPITGVVMLSLLEEGAWDLREPITKFLPELDGQSVLVDDDKYERVDRPPTMGELMSHTAGFSYGFFPETSIDALYAAANLIDPTSTLQDVVTKVAGLPLAFHPGTGCRYSIGVDLQAACAERLTGLSFAELLGERVFDPLQMTDTGYAVDSTALDRLASLHTYGPAGELLPMPIVADPATPPRLHSGGGGLYSTVSDYWRFAEMLRNGGSLDGVRILAPRTVELMRTDRLPHGVRMAPIGPYDFAGEGFGLDVSIVTSPALSIMPLCGRGTYYWGGSFGTWFWIDPASDLVFVGMMQQFPGLADGTVIPPPDVVGISSNLVYQAIVD